MCTYNINNNTLPCLTAIVSSSPLIPFMSNKEKWEIYYTVCKTINRETGNYYLWNSGVPRDESGGSNPFIAPFIKMTYVPLIRI